MFNEFTFWGGVHFLLINKEVPVSSLSLNHNMKHVFTNIIIFFNFKQR